MNKTLRMSLAFSTIAFAGASLPAFAGEAGPMRVSVPFEFKAGKTSLPAGEYVVTEEDSGIILIKGSGGSAMLLGYSGSDADPDKATISFERNDKGYVLRSVHPWGRISSSVLPVPASTEK
jgi:hypothetical protein